MERTNAKLSLEGSSLPLSPPPESQKGTKLAQQIDTGASSVEVRTPPAAFGKSFQSEDNHDMDTESLREEELDESAATAVDHPLHPPTPPSSLSSPSHTAELRKLSFSSSNSGDDEGITLKKRPRRARKGVGYAGVRKTRAKKKQVHFKDPLFEIRLIDWEAPVALDVEFTTISATDVPEKRETRTSAAKISGSTAVQVEVQPVRGIKWTGFGQNHLPRHYLAIPGQEARLKAEEEKLNKKFNRAYDPTKDSQTLVYLIHIPTGMEFSIPRNCLRPPLAAHAEQGVIKYPGQKLDFDFHESTPAGVALYQNALLMDGIAPGFFHGAWLQMVKSHPELEADSWLNILLAGLITAREIPDWWFERLVVDELLKIGGEALALGAASSEGMDVEGESTE